MAPTPAWGSNGPVTGAGMGPARRGGLVARMCAAPVGMLAALCWLAVSLVAAPAQAHPPPRGLALGWADETTLDRVLTNRGLLLLGPGGAWALRCTDAYDAQTSDRLDWYSDSADVHGFATPLGLWTSVDRGCSFTQQAAAPAAHVAAMAVHPTDPSLRWLSTAALDGADGVWRSEDAGQTFERVADNAMHEGFHDLAVHPSGTLLAAGRRADYETMQLLPLLASSLDGGVTWQVQQAEAELHHLAAHPGRDGAALAFEGREGGPGRLVFASMDGGALQPGPALDAFGGLAFGPDGDRVWVGDARTGALHVSTDGGEHFEARDPGFTEITCLVWHGSRLWLCGHQTPDVDGVWWSEDQGETFELALRFDEVRKPEPCEDGRCNFLWAEWQREVLREGLVAGGQPVAADPEAPAGGCSSARHAAGRWRWQLAAWAALGLALGARRRR